MTKPTIEQIRLAREIAAGEAMQPTAHVRSDILAGRCDDWHGVKCAIAAIIETTERAAKAVEGSIGLRALLGRTISTGSKHLATALRNNEHLQDLNTSEGEA